MNNIVDYAQKYWPKTWASICTPDDDYRKVIQDAIDRVGVEDFIRGIYSYGIYSLVLNIALENGEAQICPFCNNRTDDYYMIHDEVWQEAVGEHIHSQACILCIEEKIGRKLTKEDFTNFPINDPELTNHMTQVHIDRLTK